MSRRWQWILLRLAWAGWLLGGFASEGEIEPVPGADASVILRRVAERARLVAQDADQPACVYRTTSFLDTLDASGAVRRSREKVYEVTLRRGIPENRILSVDGRELSPAESVALSEKEKRWRDTYAGGRGGGRASLDRMDQLVNERLIQRFEFSVLGRERVRDKACWVLEFRPGAGDLPEDRLMDRVLNLLRGRIWVSVEDDEIVRADVRTEGALRLWGGFLGSLESFQLHLDRERSALGVWYNRHTEVLVRARKLFSPLHVRLREIGGDVRPLP